MADAAAFDWTCTRLEEETSLDRLEARGTVRLALKSAGLEARVVTPDQMRVVLEKVMASELSARGIADAEALCSGLASDLTSEGASMASEGASETPDAVFSRLGGGS
jgi:hypothetical protein